MKIIHSLANFHKVELNETKCQFYAVEENPYSTGVPFKPVAH